MQRYLEANETLTFTGKFTCGVTLPPPPPPPEPEEPVADPNAGRTLRIWVAAREAEVLPGGTARATITVKNTGTRTVHDLVISASVDPAVFQIAAPLPHFGIVSEDLAVWEVQELYAGKTWSVTLPLIVSKAVEQGDRTTITARASASDLAEKSGGSLLATTEIGVTGLPQTGFQFDVLFLGASMAAAALLAKKTVRRMAEQKA
jgi:hypothetical protein